ncbi:MAG TPA: class I SAM-dependent methyltransferase [Solirubrobacteraceae bacterium]|nr:class I SAM-dependent methyltransferase [Solirubrobacteraceae bacterium]
MNTTIQESTDLDILRELLAPAGREIVDVGCGGGQLVRALAAEGARVTGVEINDGQLEAARAAEPVPGASYAVGRAEALPLADASTDAVVFMRSLHHVAPDQHPAALAEAHRVLRPDGRLYVAEPLAEGDLYALTRMVENEDGERAAAQATIAAAGDSGFAPVASRRYDVVLDFPDVDAFRRMTVSVDPARAAVYASRAGEIAERFTELGEPGPGGGRRLRLPMKADVLAPTVP